MNEDRIESAGARSHAGMGGSAHSQEAELRGTPSPLSRAAGVGGLVFATVIVLANAILVPAGLPHAGATIDEVVQFFATREAAVGVATALIPLAWIGSTLFAAGVVTQVRSTDRVGNGPAFAWALVGFAGVLLQNGAFAAVVALRLALATTADLDPATVGLAWRVHDALFTLNGTFLATALLGLSLAGRQSRMTGRLHLGLGLTAASLLFGSATLSPVVVTTGGPFGLLGLVGWLLWVTWIVLLAARLISGRGRPAGATPPS